MGTKSIKKSVNLIVVNIVSTAKSHGFWKTTKKRFLYVQCLGNSQLLSLLQVLLLQVENV
jgi:hypothetical protein